MTEYVKKSEVLDTLWKADGITFNGIEVLNHMPAEDVVEVKRGRWEQHDYYDEDANVYVCSVCHEPWMLNAGTPKDNNMHYCPNCGARMVEYE